ncbi:energy-coupling factor transporter transmembrane component T family protein [candidate division KSB1 bacterium]
MKLNNIIVGKYYHKDSFIHTLDPRTKFLSLLVILPTIAIINNFFFLAGVTFIIFFALISAKIQLKYFFRQLIPFLWIIVITYIIHLLFTDGRFLFQIPAVNITITYEGAYNGFFYSLRILLLLSYSSLFMLTTAPVDITDGAELLFKPLKKIHIPVDTLALMVSIALRFIPTIFEETERIRKAQIARGAEIEKGILKRIKSLSSLIIPVFVSVYRRADDLAVAMKARGYPPRKKKTYYRNLRLTIPDIGVIAFICLFNGTFLFLDLYIYG